MNHDVQKGYDFAKGCAIYITRCFIIGALFLCLFALVRNAAGWGVDDSDRDGWNRSGLRVHTDAKTGVQYLSDGNGGLTRRE